MSEQLEILKALKAQVESAIAYIESGMPMKDMTPLERLHIQLVGHYDFTIGDFRIKRVTDDTHGWVAALHKV